MNVDIPQMKLEIESKFTVSSEGWRANVERWEHYWQGYLSTQVKPTTRVRLSRSPDRDYASIAIKGSRRGITRLEFEYEIPTSDAEQMLELLCEKPLLEKTRHFLTYAGLMWHIDEFWGENIGLITAEVELDHVNQQFALPIWAGDDVTANRDYHNSSLTRKPFKSWRLLALS